VVTAHLLQGLARLEELARKLMDIVDNRVQANLDAVKGMLLVDLPADRCVDKSCPTACACVSTPLQRCQVDCHVFGLSAYSH
jgi:hypothetical protein